MSRTWHLCVNRSTGAAMQVAPGKAVPQFRTIARAHIGRKPPETPCSTRCGGAADVIALRRTTGRPQFLGSLPFEYRIWLYAPMGYTFRL